MSDFRTKPTKFPFRSAIFDIAGVITDVRLVTSKKIKLSMERAQLCNFNISFLELIRAYSSGGFEEIFKQKKVAMENKRLFYETWGEIQENPYGEVWMYDDVVPILQILEKSGVQLAFASRLYGDNFKNVIKTLRDRGFDGEIKEAYPQDEKERYRDDCMGFIIKRAIDKTEAPRVYIDDSLDRAKLAKAIDRNIICFGSGRGFFNSTELMSAGCDYVVCSLWELLEKMKKKTTRR